MDAPRAAALGLERSADGWRGVIGGGFTLGAVAELTAAIADELVARDLGETALVAHDGRTLSRDAAWTAGMILGGHGIRADVTGPLPTPVASFAVQHALYAAALIVTASHNPATWNGVKLKVSPGAPPTDELERAIETRRGAAGATPRRRTRGPRLVGPDTLARAFVARMAELSPVEDASRFHVVVDGLNGIAGGGLASLLETIGCRVTRLGCDPDERFGGLVPDPLRPASRTRAARRVVEAGADLALLVDGDGDRLAVCDDAGRFITSGDVAASLLARARKNDPEPPAVALTVATSRVVSRAAVNAGLRVIETPIGFKHLAPHLIRGTAILGAGAVGDIGLRVAGVDRNPFLAATLFLDEMAAAGGSARDLVRGLRDLHGDMAYDEALLDIRADGGALESFAAAILRETGLARRVRAVTHGDGIKVDLGDWGWVLIRGASTEPGVRVYVEAAREADCRDLLTSARKRART